MEKLIKNINCSFNEQIANNLINSFDKKCYSSFWFNEEKITEDEILKLFPNLIKHPYIKNSFIFDKDEYEISKSFLHELGAIYIQDSSSQMVPYFLNPKPYDHILDICAAPGGKTLLSSYMMKSKGIIVANDVSFNRINEMINNVERLGASNIVATNLDFLNIENSKFQLFDKIILDAPCSGSGMIRKDKKMLDDWSYNKVIKFQEIQKNMILKAFDLLKDGGIMSYSTCSFSKEENEDVISFLLEKRDAEIIHFDHNNDIYEGNTRLGMHFLPSLFKGEGQFISIIRKKGNINKNEYKNEKFLLDFKDLNNRHSIIFNNFKYSLNESYNLKKIHIIRYGLKENEINKDVIKYEYHLSHALSSFINEYELNNEEYVKIKKGDIVYSNLKGWILLKYKNIPVCFGKGDGKIIKNHYPKHLRIN